MSGPFIGDPSFAQNDSQKIDWLVQAVLKIQRWITDNDPSVISDAFTTTGIVTKARSLDAAAGTATDVRNVLATLISDLRTRGSKGV